MNIPYKLIAFFSCLLCSDRHCDTVLCHRLHLFDFNSGMVSILLIKYEKQHAEFPIKSLKCRAILDGFV